ncbi:hypothetical protein GYMLUDRAFT_60711 [Collybiopsis luxurians FD-317 M1]|uniref:Uncharacterized protein n=1 Tax=Collybiopsis luxurians FD-317 M1 TaxID=944289 RepID=A0A0D0BST0_9AGAR|nr:hypothetical protein GYMLUDRAFT_60711 [Collybiopsis luxurians FD-317 M1]
MPESVCQVHQAKLLVSLFLKFHFSHLRHRQKQQCITKKQAGMPTAFQVLCMSSSSESTSGSSLSSSLSTSSSSSSSSHSSGEDSDLSNELWLSTAQTELQLTCFTVNYSETDTDSSDEESNRSSDTSSVSDPDADILTSSHN